ncbi:transcription-repair coupling factor [Parenemella sanctibonifatiensis]|uniref:Transcription-repair-coupling factor n=1 Tax=Parenemella sanctibonifatiensis TaxID=2016505 RepID=A0A255ELC9_9ACTN|nr:transcription-repair coupling factor [Parenemella sanctibonifatiensis]OYN92337.1 transcription-repair coupling factor [Parenemella sanctibonifatiensis]
MNSGLLQRAGQDPVLTPILGRDRSIPGPDTGDVTGPDELRPWLVGLAAQPRADGTPAPTQLVVTSTYREAEQLAAELAAFLPADDVAYYPAWETLPHERLSPRSDTVGKRLTVLRRLAGHDTLPAPRVVVAPVRSVLQPQVKGLAELTPVRIEIGQEYPLDELTADLSAAAYHRVDLVERRGEFAVRGGIVDIFCPTDDHPVRIDFFGDEVEEIHWFQVADQRSTDPAGPVIIAPPCRELLLDDGVRARAAELAQAHPELAEMLDRIAEGHAVDGMEAMSPVLVDAMELLVDVLPADTVVLVCDPELVRTRAADLTRTSQEFLGASWAAAAGGGEAPIDLGESAYWELGEVREHALDRGLGWWSLSPFSAGPAAEPVRTDDGEIIDLSGAGADARVVTSVTVDAKPAESMRGDTDAVVARARRALAEGWQVVITAEGQGLVNRMAAVLREADLPVRVGGELDPAVVVIDQSPLRGGIEWPAIKLLHLTGGDLAGRSGAERDAPMPTRRRKNQVNPLELSPGDAVVHEHHGVGRYIEMVQRAVGGATREYIVVEYAASKRGQPGDRVFVPMDQLDLLTRYVGGESPTLDRMGGGDWQRRKSRARKAVREIAGELIQLYAARQATRGHAFSPDTTWQRELEDSFSFVETPDQLSAINEVKHDMEQVVPMDRLICGDVGYGKTEIAVRAAFKAVQDGKQVAVLVPTTLLVSQHYQTFAERYAGFPVRVGQLSRFQSDKESAKTREEVESGAIDVIVGTHRLLSGEVRFKDLGLVIIDEEQRFGVEHKEQLKRLRTNVDVLAMSATPIPRTLEMAVTGIREMSVIATPPEERHPVLTFAGPYDRAQVTAAIRRELAREGQVFYIHNRVQSIEKTARTLRELVPEARIATAHGQMSEKALEQVMEDFWQRRADVLVCTTIVEAGLDINTANTLLIERSDLLGLSQLHQLRGRVGRGRERGYAYFLYPPEKPLTETAHDRLATMAANTDLGAGMAIAMKDLEIRGAGNLLGGEQSGHIADVGFDLYLRLVGEAVTEYRGDGVEPEPEVRIELPVEAHLPVDYIESERLRLEMYKRLAETRTEEDLAGVHAELVDRYGEPGEPVEALFEVARLRIAARAAGLTELILQGNQVRLGQLELPDSTVMRLQRLHPGTKVRAASKQVMVPRPRPGRVGAPPIIGRELLAWARQLVTALG